MIIEIIILIIIYNVNKNKNKNKNLNYNNIINYLNNDILKTNDNLINFNSINVESYSPKKKIQISNTGINMFKESIIKGKSLINKRRNDYFKDDLFRIQKRDSKKVTIFKEQEKGDEEISEKEDGNKLYEHIKYKKSQTSKEVGYFNTNNNQIIDNKDLTNNNIKNKIISNNKNNNENKTISLTKDSNPKIKNQKYLNILRNNSTQITKKACDFKISKLNFMPIDNIQQNKTLNSDGILSSSSKASKNFNINNLTKTYLYNKFDNFNYNVVTLGDNASLENESKDYYSVDLETLKKRSIRLNLVSPLSNDILKTFQNEKKRHNSYKEFNIKASPAFGSSSYSFYHLKHFPKV